MILKPRHKQEAADGLHDDIKRLGAGVGGGINIK